MSREHFAYEKLDARNSHDDTNYELNYGVHYGRFTSNLEPISISVKWFRTELEQKELVAKLVLDGAIPLDQVRREEKFYVERFAKEYTDGDYVLDLMARSTDDTTAHPVFLVMKDSTEVSQDSYRYVDFEKDDLEEFSLSFMSDSIDLTRFFDEDDGFEDTEELQAYFDNYGYGYHIDYDGNQLVYWSKEDEIKKADVQCVFWTREEADEYCEAFKYNGPYYSYSVPACGVLKEFMGFTCEREIERIAAKKENRKSKL